MYILYIQTYCSTIDMSVTIVCTCMYVHVPILHLEIARCRQSKYSTYMKLENVHTCSKEALHFGFSSPTCTYMAPCEFPFGFSFHFSRKILQQQSLLPLALSRGHLWLHICTCTCTHSYYLLIRNYMLYKPASDYDEMTKLIFSIFHVENMQFPYHKLVSSEKEVGHSSQSERLPTNLQ